MNGEMHVVFGTGPLGKSVMRELVKQGKPTRMVNRSGKADVPNGVEVVAGDAYDISFTREVTKDAAVVYQCAQPGYTEWQEKFPPLQTAILEGTAANNAKLIVGENLYMYGDVDGRIHEGLPYSAKTKKGKVRAQMANQLLEAHRTGKVRVAMARGSDFFGPEVMGSSLGEREIYPLIAGKKVQVYGNPDLPHTYTFIDDFGKAMVILGEREEALGQAWHVPNAPTLTQRQLVTILFQEAGHPPKIGTLSPLMMRIGGLFIPEARETVEMMYEFTKPYVVDSSKFVRAFGDIATSHQEAARKTVEWFKAHPHQS
jgi:nucleoside-diphosphate-sugar epimerase